MANAEIDENRERTALGVDSTGIPRRLKVDPVTGRLLIKIVNIAAGSPILNNGKIDENRKHTAFAVNSTGDIRPLLIDNRNGYLMCSVTTT